MNLKIPKNYVIYRKPNYNGYYGYSNNGTLVSSHSFQDCCSEVLERNYVESEGISAFDAYLRVWEDVKAAYPEEWDLACEEAGIDPSDINSIVSGNGYMFEPDMRTLYDALMQIRFQYFTSDLGFEESPGPDLLSFEVSTVDEVKSEIRKALFSGANFDDVSHYLCELFNKRVISEDQSNELGLWASNLYHHNWRKLREVEVDYSEDTEDEEDDDIMSSTKITANTTAGTPKNLVIYKKLNDDCYGFTDSGRKVTDGYYDSCCRSVIMENYMERGMDYNQAYFQFWLDVRDFSPKEFDEICEDYGGVDITDLEHDRNFDDALQGDELYELAYKYIDELGFHSELDPELFPTEVSTPEEVKSIAKKAMLAGADDYILTNYLERLHYVHHKFDWGEYQELRTWVNQKFNAGKFGKKVYDILTDNISEEDEEDDIMSSTKITANYNFNYDVVGKDAVLDEVKNAMKYGTTAKDLGWFLDWMCFEENKLTLDDYDDILAYIRRFHRNWYQEKFKQYEEEDDSEEEDDILGSTKIYSTMTFPEAQVLIRRKFLSGANYLDMIRYIRNLLSSNQIDQSLYSQIHKWLDNEARDLRRGHKLMVDLLENADDEEEDVMSSTKITATTNSAGTPIEPVIYEKAGQQGFYGYSNGGKKVTAPSWDRCAMNIVMQNYIESGMSEDDARYQFWQDVKDFDPEAMIERCGGDLDVRSEEFEYIRSEGLLNQLRFDYLAEGLGFYDELDQNIFDYTVSTMEEIKASIKKAMLAGATPNQYFDYFNYLVNDGVITLDEYEELSNYIETKFEDSGFRIKNYARVYENSDDEDEEDDITTSTKIKENKIMGRKFTKKPRYFANMVSADTNMSDERLIGIVDGDGMGGYVYIIKTNAPKSRLSELEQECSYCNCDDMPDWAEVLTEEGYTYTYIDECRHVTPYGTSEEWLEDKYPGVIEMYYIDCD